MHSPTDDGDEGGARGDGDAPAASDGTDPADERETPAGTGTERDGRDEREGVRDGDGDRTGTREVVVPLRLYKTVTVFSTLIAVVCVVGGFVLLDAATFQWIFLRQVVSDILSVLGVDVAREVVSAALALAGLAVIGVGSGVYVLGTRFRASGMGNSQEDSNEGVDNG